jgi:hypothetical protein
MKEGSLFVLFVLVRSHLNLDASDHVLSLFGKLSRRRGASAWGFMVFGLVVQKFLSME